MIGLKFLKPNKPKSNSYEHGLIKVLCDVVKLQRILEIVTLTGTMTLIFSLNKGIEKVISLEYEA